MGIPKESEEERRLRHQELFNRLDVDDKGFFKLETLQKVFEELEHPLRHNKDAIESIFNALDWNRDLVVDLKDFEHYINVAETQIKYCFEQIDCDNDGKIRAEELSNYLSNVDKTSSSNGDRDMSKSTIQLKNFIQWAFCKQNTKTDTNNTYITYDQWRDFLLLMPQKEGSRLHTAYSYFYLFNEDVDLSSEGDMTLINDFIRGFSFFIAGGVAGVVSRTCTAPFDRIKVFLIARIDLSSTLLNSAEKVVQHNPKADISKLRSPIIKAAQSLYRQGGLRAFYVGNGLNVVKVFPESAIKFGTFELTKKLLAPLTGCGNSSELSKFYTYIAGGLGGIMAQFVSYPIDTLKFRIQCAPLDTNFKGIDLLIKTFREMYAEGGLRIFYRGIGVGVMGVFPYAALDLGTFSVLKAAYVKNMANKLNVKENQVEMSNLVVLTIGAFSGTVGATIVYPINLLRTRLQAQGTFAHPYKYSGFKDVFIKTVQKEGFQGLYKGLVPTLAKLCPAVSISYLCYENLKKLMRLE